MITSLTKDNGYIGGLYREDQATAARMASALALLSFNGGMFPDAQRLLATGLEFSPGTFASNLAAIIADEVLDFYGVSVEGVASTYHRGGE